MATRTSSTALLAARVDDASVMHSARRSGSLQGAVLQALGLDQHVRVLVKDRLQAAVPAVFQHGAPIELLASGAQERGDVGRSSRDRSLAPPGRRTRGWRGRPGFRATGYSGEGSHRAGGGSGDREGGQNIFQISRAQPKVELVHLGCRPDVAPAPSRGS